MSDAAATLCFRTLFADFVSTVCFAREVSVRMVVARCSTMVMGQLSTSWYILHVEGHGKHKKHRWLFGNKRDTRDSR